MGGFHVHADDHDHAHEHGPDGAGPERPRRDVGDHGGYRTAFERVEVLERILSENDRVARSNRARFEAAGARAVNLMSAPGAGKTALLRRTLAELRSTTRVGVVEGDIETDLDAEALTGLGAEISLVNTSAGFGGECHLDAVMVASGLARLPLEQLDLVLIENVGNLVCPAEFDVGAHARAMVVSVTEGEDKPLKYPVMFRAADFVAVNKIDLLPHLEVDLDLLLANIRGVNPHAEVALLSVRTGEGVDTWFTWLRGVLHESVHEAGASG